MLGFLWCVGGKKISIDYSLGYETSSRIGVVVLKWIEVDLLLCILIDGLHCLRMHGCVCIVEHLLHCWEHWLVDVRCWCAENGALLNLTGNDEIWAIFGANHAICLLDDHASIFDSLLGWHMSRKVIHRSVAWPACRRYGAGVNVGIDDSLILLWLRELVTWKQLKSL